MFFRNLTLFRFDEAVATTLAEVAASLDEHRLRPCGPIEMATRGFVSPFGRDSDELVHQVGDFTLFTVGGEDKLLPSSVVNEELAKKLDDIQHKESRKAGPKERKRLKDEVITDLLPRAFVRTSRQHSYFDLPGGWMVIDSASRKSAEEAVTQVREALGSFPATPLAPSESPRALLTDWLTTGNLPPNLTLGDEVELRDPAEAGAVVRCRRQDLELDEIREHLKSGKQVFQLGLEFDERLSFVLGEDLVIRKLRFLDIVLDEIDEASLESSRAELDATFTLMTLEIRRLLDAMSGWFGIGREPALRLDPAPTPKSMRGHKPEKLERAVRVTKELYDQRDFARRVLGADYLRQVVEVSALIRARSEANDLPLLKATMAMVEEANQAGRGDSVPLLFASYVEMVEPTPAVAAVSKAARKFVDRIEKSGASVTISTGDTSVTIGADAALYPKACEIVSSTGKTGVAHLQRVLRLGYNQAARLIERMADEGILTDPDRKGVRQLAQPPA